MEANNGWRYIQGTWYYFDENGYAATGWRLINGKWYYMNSECKMQTGWLNLNDKWYYTDSTALWQSAGIRFRRRSGIISMKTEGMAVNTVMRRIHDSGDGKMQ